MLRIMLALTLAMICCSEAATQEKNVECPKITVLGPADIINPGETMTFTATVGKDGDSSLKYNWTIENGTIQRGQGTSTLVVTFKPSEEWQPKAVATVEVIGLPTGCSSTASEIYTYVVDPGPMELDEFSRLAEITNQRLKKIADRANEERNAQIYIFLPAEKKIRDSIASRLNKLITVQNKGGARLTFIWNERKDCPVRIWLILPGVTPPVGCRAF